MAKNRLGKGLGALLPDEGAEQKAAGTEKAGKPAGAQPETAKIEKSGTEERLVPLNKIAVNPAQPRKRFDEEALKELAESVKQHGIIQPIIVDEISAEGRGGGTTGDDETEGGYRIVAGERRFRAAKLAGLTEVPVLVRNYTGEKRLEIALIENIHRADLNPIEEAAAYKRIMENGGLSQDETAVRVGKNRSTVANALRLLKLPVNIQESLEDGSLSAGHARAILSLSKPADQEKLYREITGEALSVRAAELRAAGLGGKAAPAPAGTNKAAADAKRDPQLKTLEEKLIEKLGTKVKINGDLKKGRVEIEYYSMNDLDRLCELLG
jgi:ParB family chromosome partitioning protein